MLTLDSLKGLQNHKVYEFASTCLQLASADELDKALQGAIDTRDCNTWEISPQEWKLAVLVVKLSKEQIS